MFVNLGQGEQKEAAGSGFIRRTEFGQEKQITSIQTKDGVSTEVTAEGKKVVEDEQAKKEAEADAQEVCFVSEPNWDSSLWAEVESQRFTK